MKKLRYLLILFLSQAVHAQDLRPPAYPLITHDPYLSIWSFSDTLNASQSKHWTGRDYPMLGFIKVDGETYQFSGTAPVQYHDVLPTAEEGAYEVPYTYEPPAQGWEKPAFDDSQWKKGKAPFGDGASSNTLRPNTPYNKDIWYRRSFSLENTDYENLQLYISHDDGVEVYINGIMVFESDGYSLRYINKPIAKAAIQSLKKSGNVLAVHCTNGVGGAYIDVGLVEEEQLARIEPATQQSVDVSATQTRYTFQAGPVDLQLKFTSPLLLDQLEVLSRPASYITFEVSSNDSQAHAVELLFGVSAVFATDQPKQEVDINEQKQNGLQVQSVGSVSQKVLGKKGDDVRIDWGYAYLAAADKNTITPIAHDLEVMLAFANGNTSIGSGTASKKAADNFMGFTMNLGELNQAKTEHLILAYDQLYAVEYFGENLRPWWRRDADMTAEKMLVAAEKDYPRLLKQCDDFDAQLMQEATSAGGKAYAQLCALAYRQTIAAHTAVESPEGELFFFSKENFSNGSIGTVDITYPSSPLFILYNTEVMKGLLRFIFDYSESGRWTKPFAAHDVGTYPLANGQTYGEDMPVEESGNMIILTAAIAMKDDEASFAEKHWETLTRWVEFLKKEGFDPANQLSTDDFAGHLARNANLSVKAIMGIAAYGKLAEMLGKEEVAREHTQMAKDMAQRWMQLAEDGDHYSLAFETPDTWSQKYNLVWDDILGFNIFPPSVVDKEIAQYKEVQNKYGLPLDSRRTYTKSDWILWTATLADNEQDFQTLVQPVWDFANETPDRIPLSDWHETTNAESVGFRARSVVGGYFIKLLKEDMNPQN